MAILRVKAFWKWALRSLPWQLVTVFIVEVRNESSVPPSTIPSVGSRSEILRRLLDLIVSRIADEFEGEGHCLLHHRPHVLDRLFCIIPTSTGGLENQLNPKLIVFTDLVKVELLNFIWFHFLGNSMGKVTRTTGSSSRNLDNTKKELSFLYKKSQLVLGYKKGNNSLPFRETRLGYLNDVSGVISGDNLFDHSFETGRIITGPEMNQVSVEGFLKNFTGQFGISAGHGKDLSVLTRVHDQHHGVTQSDVLKKQKRSIL